MTANRSTRMRNRPLLFFTLTCTHSFTFHSACLRYTHRRNYHYTPFNISNCIRAQSLLGSCNPWPRRPNTRRVPSQQYSHCSRHLNNMATAPAMADLSNLPPLPDYHLTPLPPLLPPIPDKLLTLLLPIVAYWGLSLFFHWIDTKDYFPQHRLHTPAEVSKRNRVSRWEVVRDVVIQQVVQTAVGWVLGMTEPDDFFGKEEYDIAVWARRLRIVQRSIPGLLASVGLDAGGLAKKLGASHPMLGGALRGGQYPSLESVGAVDSSSRVGAPGFARWELMLASAIYWVLIPALQFGLAILVVDTWQYFLHRAMHMNKWLYSTSLEA